MNMHYANDMQTDGKMYLRRQTAKHIEHCQGQEAANTSQTCSLLRAIQWQSPQL